MLDRYLEETQVPEWRASYIDYENLKKLISAAEADIDAQKKAATPGRRFTFNKSNFLFSGRSSPALPSGGGNSPTTVRFRQQGNTNQTRSEVLGWSNMIERLNPSSYLTNNNVGWSTSLEAGFGGFGRTSALVGNAYGASNSLPEMIVLTPITPSSDSRSDEQFFAADDVLDISSENSDKLQNETIKSFGLPVTTPSARIEDSPVTPRRPSFTSRRHFNYSGSSSRGPVTLVALIADLPPVQAEFFKALDRELIKVEGFYREREEEAMARSAIIKEQLEELKDHRKIFYAYEDQRFMASLPKALNKFTSHLSPSTFHRGHREEDSATQPASTSRRDASHNAPRFDPDEYQQAKKRLKRSVLELYRGIEHLQNYRILNLTGFRKALKKFDKITKRHMSQLYHNEKIKPSILSHPATIDNIALEVENMFAARFEGGDRKKAKSRLRATAKPRNHYFSIFRSGLLIGLSIPAMVAGVYEAYQYETQQRIQAWSSLLQVYLGFFIAVIFGLLLSLNVIVWAHVKINYIFTFEIDIRTAVDSREHAELPAFLLMTLAYVFWLSFSGLNSDISPTSWPLIWLIFALLVIFNPFPVFYPYSRRWILLNSGKLFISGTRRVEFGDTFIGDQYCSMAFSLTNFYYMGCLYQSQWGLPWGQCELPIWAIPWIITTLPVWIRFIQCSRRYMDCGQFNQLVNAGKYCSVTLYYAAYYHWRAQGSPRDSNFVFYIICAVVMSIYTTVWDFLMDWRVFQRNTHYPFLRTDLIYMNHIWTYYFAIISNTLFHFAWIIYLPVAGPATGARAASVAIAEAIRRFQWNFFRVENEHLANHQMMKDIPLPYSVDLVEISDDDGDEDDPVPVSSKPVQRQEVWFSTVLIGVYGLLMGSLWALMALISTYTVEMV